MLFFLFCMSLLLDNASALRANTGGLLTSAANGIQAAAAAALGGGSAPVPDKLFGILEKSNEGREWGRFLDAGTGTHSLKWVHSLDTKGWTAVTADEAFGNNMKKQLGFSPGKEDSIVVGNWNDEAFLEGQVFDTILADYLIGAVDGFSPFFQDQVFTRIRRHLAPGGRLYIIGLQPIPDHPGGIHEIISEVTRIRDCCILLAGHRPYREYPQSWIERQLGKSGYVVKSSTTLPILYSEKTIIRQLDVAAKKLPLFKDPALAAAMKQHIADVTERVRESTRAADNGRLQLGFDYVVTAEVRSEEGEGEGGEGSGEGSSRGKGSSRSQAGAEQQGDGGRGTAGGGDQGRADEMSL